MTLSFSRVVSIDIYTVVLGIIIAISGGCATSTHLSKSHEIPGDSFVDTQQTMKAAQQETDQYTKILDSTFQAEKADRDWSNRTIDEIHRTFERKNAAGTLIVDIQCRLTLCRVVAEGDPIQVGKMLHRSLPEFSANFSHSLTTSAIGTGDQAKSVIYLVRKGHTLP